jgi:hypothetical protein
MSFECRLSALQSSPLLRLRPGGCFVGYSVFAGKRVIGSFQPLNQLKSHAMNEKIFGNIIDAFMPDFYDVVALEWRSPRVTETPSSQQRVT